VNAQHRVMYLLFNQDFEKALKAAKPILTGKQSCNVIPLKTYGLLLIPLLHLGKKEEAERYHKKGLASFKNNQERLRWLSHHLTYLALTHQLDEALSLFERYVEAGLSTFELEGQFYFALAASLMFKRFKETERSSLSLRLPQSCPIAKADRQYETSDLIQYFVKLSEDSAQAFDSRNETKQFQDIIAEHESLLKMF